MASLADKLKTLDIKVAMDVPSQTLQRAVFLALL
jgi:hypothetical protein